MRTPHRALEHLDPKIRRLAADSADARIRMIEEGSVHRARPQSAPEGTARRTGRGSPSNPNAVPAHPGRCRHGEDGAAAPVSAPVAGPNRSEYRPAHPSHRDRQRTAGAQSRDPLVRDPRGAARPGGDVFIERSIRPALFVACSPRTGRGSWCSMRSSTSVTHAVATAPWSWTRSRRSRRSAR